MHPGPERPLTPPDEPRRPGRVVVTVGTTTDGPLSGYEDVPRRITEAIEAALQTEAVDYQVERVDVFDEGED